MAPGALPRPIAQGLGALRAAWREIGGDAGRLTAWTRVVSTFLNAHASTWDPAVVNAVADEFNNYASMIEGGMLMEDFNEGQTLAALGSRAAQEHLPTLNRLYVESQSTTSNRDDRTGTRDRRRQRSRSPGRDDERGTFNRRDRSPRGRYTPEAEVHSLAKGASGPPHYKLQRLRPF